MKFLNHLTTLLAKRRLTWLPFVLLLTPLVLLRFAVVVLVSTAIHLYGTWNWQWRDEWAEWFGAFTEKHRRRVHTLARGRDNRRELCDIPLVHIPNSEAPRMLQ
jgi:hypothetical protein